MPGAAGGRWRWNLTFWSPLGCRAPSQASESCSFIVQLGEAGYAVFREVKLLAFAIPLGLERSGENRFLFGFRNLLQSHLRREALRALRSALSHTPSPLKALLSNCLGAHQHFLVGLYLCIFFVYALSLPTEI